MSKSTDFILIMTIYYKIYNAQGPMLLLSAARSPFGQADKKDQTSYYLDTYS